ncbi:MAG: excinuclease ABC subunit UvrA [Pirellulales bacterium]
MATSQAGPLDGTALTEGESLRIRGARVHNLKNIDLDIPHDQLVVITGPSGSGKSSLAFDTIFAEGQRQYFESLSAYARQFLDQLERPDADLIEGLRPTIAIQQRADPSNPRSTVATVTEIQDYLRVLLARLGEASCYQCGAPIRQQSSEQVVEELSALPEGTKIMLLAPLVRGRKGEHAEVIESMRKAGFNRTRIDGTVHELDAVPSLARQQAHTIEAVVDRIIVRPGIETRLAESIQHALRHGEGVVSAALLAVDDPPDTWRDRLFSTLYACPDCKISYEELEPRTFSFNSPYGACPACNGLGLRRPAEGEPGPPDDAAGEPTVCQECGGTRLRPEARAVRLAGLAIHEIVALTISQAREFFAGIRFDQAAAPIGERPVAEIVSRLGFLEQVGVGYLSLDRPSDSLSGGEAQRVRLASGIGSGLVGICYVLDEPSIGLHPRDNQRLIDALKSLQQQGNSVLVVEHDEALMRQADWLIDMGPGAGQHGGHIVAQGTPEELCRDPASLTGRYLCGELRVAKREQRRPFNEQRQIVLQGAATHNLKNVEARFPLGLLTCVTGVSGSGKSSLVNDTLAHALARQLGLSSQRPGPYTGLLGAEQIDKLVMVDQSPLGRNSRSNPATYMGAFDEIRKVFTRTRESRLRGYKSGRFSFNAAGGRCEDCQGLGQRTIDMFFLPDLHVTCPVCEGKRFNRQTLEILYRHKSIADVLEMRINEALEFFENFPVLRRMLRTLAEVGLDYLTLGQSAATLSGGESQRIRLAAELSRADTGQTMYILDEPTTGLHLADIARLLDVLQRLVDRGNTVIVIEHHLNVIRAADWLIDLGPEGGAGGGQVTAAGTPEQLAALPGNHTGHWLSKA